MAKTKSTSKSALRSKIAMLTKGIAVYQSTQKALHAKKLNTFVNKLYKSYSKQATAAGGNSQYVAGQKRVAINRFDHKQHWQYRALSTAYARELFAIEAGTSKLEMTKQQLTEQYTTSVAKLNEQRITAVDKITKKFDKKVKSGKLDEVAAQQVIEQLAQHNEQLIADYNNKLQSECDNAIDTHNSAVNAKLQQLRTELASQAGNVDMLTGDEILRLDNLSMHFGGLKAVDELSFSVNKGEIFGLIGPNGAGKTTVFNCITQFNTSTAGKVYYRSNEGEVLLLNDEKVHDVVNYGIVRTFQNVELVWELTVLDNLLIAAHSSYTSGLVTQMLHLPKLAHEDKLLRARAVEVLEYLDLMQYAGRTPYGLPYGILKRIELARTLMCDPQLIILDEPAAGLNDQETVELAHLIKRIRDEKNVTIFLVEHDMGLVMSICDRICAISFGKLLSIGTPEYIQADKSVQEAYLGIEEDDNG